MEVNAKHQSLKAAAIAPSNTHTRVEKHLQHQKQRKLDFLYKRRKQRSKSEVHDYEGPITLEEFRDDIINNLKDSQLSITKRALKKLRRLLSKDEIEWCNKGYPFDQELIHLLMKHLQTNNHLENQLEAAWCLTNLASCSSNLEIVKLVIPTTPILIQYLSPFIEDSQCVLCEQCCWCLGNLAAENQLPQLRTQLLQMGILQPLLKLIDSNQKHSSVKETAIWCLLNLIRDNQISFLHILQQPQFLAVIMRQFLVSHSKVLEWNEETKKLLQSKMEHNYYVELCWIFVYLTTVQEEGLLQQILFIIDSQYPVFAQHIFLMICSTEDLQKKIRSPVLRIFGNMLFVKEMERNLLPTSQHVIFLLKQCNTWLQEIGFFEPVQQHLHEKKEIEERLFIRELFWMLSNICGSSSDYIIEQIIQSKLIDALFQENILTKLDSEQKEELLYMITNLCVSTTLVAYFVDNDPQQRIIRFVCNLLQTTNMSKSIILRCIQFVKSILQSSSQSAFIVQLLKQQRFPAMLTALSENHREVDQRELDSSILFLLNAYFKTV